MDPHANRRPASQRRRTNGFDFSRHMRQLCIDLTLRLPELRHVDLARVAIGFCQARSGHLHGLQATLTPLRFEQGQLVTMRAGRRWSSQRVYDSSGREMLYVLSFYLPRFMNLPFREKLVTVLHELWHISPRFDGDLRRYSGRCSVHGPSEQRYDNAMELLADRWLARNPPAEVYAFIRHSFEELQNRYGVVKAIRVPTPKLIPLDHENRQSVSQNSPQYPT